MLKYTSKITADQFVAQQQEQYKSTPIIKHIKCIKVASTRAFVEPGNESAEVIGNGKVVG